MAGGAVEEIENDLLVAVLRQIECNLPIALSLRVLRSDSDLFGSVSAATDTDRDLLTGRHVAKIQNYLGPTRGRCGTGGSRSGYCCAAGGSISCRRGTWGLGYHRRRSAVDEGIVELLESLLGAGHVTGPQSSADRLEILLALGGCERISIGERTGLPQSLERLIFLLCTSEVARLERLAELLKIG